MHDRVAGVPAKFAPKAKRILHFDIDPSEIHKVKKADWHHVGLLPNQTILIAIDCWEHAYFADYQTKKAAYVDGLLQHINWPAVAARWARCEALEREIAHVGA